MKRTISLFLALILLSTCLTACGSKEEVQFGADVFNYMYDTMEVLDAMDGFTIAVADCLEEDGIRCGIEDDAFMNRCIYHYNELLAQWRAEGIDVSGQSIEEFSERILDVSDQYVRISQNTTKAENGDELREAVERLHLAEQNMLTLIDHLYGPADQYRNRALEISSRAAKASSDIIELLQPYYQKPGFVQLQERS